MTTIIPGGLVLAAALFATGAQAQTAPAPSAKPTIILVHGAFADSSSWNRVIPILQRGGYTVIAAPNPLSGVRVDANVVADVIKSIDGPVVLVGHSYAGSVISEAAEGLPNVIGLVYVAAFAPDSGETALALTGQFPGAGNTDAASYWSGLRPMPPDGTPVIGATPYDNLFLNTGHGTLGWTMACGSGRLIADLVSGRPTDIKAADLSIARYEAR